MNQNDMGDLFKIIHTQPYKSIKLENQCATEKMREQTKRKVWDSGNNSSNTGEAKKRPKNCHWAPGSAAASHERTYTERTR